MKKISLKDDFFVAGSSYEEFREAVNTFSEITCFKKVRSDALGLLYRLDDPDAYGCFKVALCSGPELNLQERSWEDAARDPEKSRFLLPVGTLSYSMLNKDLAEESFKTNGAILTVARGREEDILYISGHARNSLLGKAGLCGPFTAYTDKHTGQHSLFVTQAIADGLYKNPQWLTLVTRTVDGNEKVFSFLSKKYADVSVGGLPDIVDGLLADGHLGKPVIREWYVDHSIARIHLEFPEAGEDYSDFEDLPAKMIPGLEICTSDTGDCSFIIRATYRPEKGGNKVITDEYARRHVGDLTKEKILEACDREVMANFRRLPEALARKMSILISQQTIDSPSEERKNASVVKQAIRRGITTLGLSKILGQKRSRGLLDQLFEEVDGRKVYAEYDLAMIFLNLSDRIGGVSDALRTRIAKCCGQAPFISYGGKEIKEEITLLPDMDVAM